MEKKNENFLSRKYESGNQLQTIFENSLLGYKKAAQYLSISESYLRRLKSKKQIPFVPIGKRGVRFKIAHLNTWVAEREIK